jgi:hypothetical protein
MWPNGPELPPLVPFVPRRPTTFEIVRELNADAETISKFHKELLFERDNYTDANLPRKAQLHYLQALQFMCLAEQSLKLASEEMPDL